MSKEKSCFNCKFCQIDSGINLSGFCRKNPPVPIFDGTVIQSYFPRVNLDRVCGHHEYDESEDIPKEDEKENTGYKFNTIKKIKEEERKIIKYSNVRSQIIDVLNQNGIDGEMRKTLVADLYLCYMY